MSEDAHEIPENEAIELESFSDEETSHVFDHAKEMLFIETMKKLTSFVEDWCKYIKFIESKPKLLLATLKFFPAQEKSFLDNKLGMEQEIQERYGEALSLLGISFENTKDGLYLSILNTNLFRAWIREVRAFKSITAEHSSTCISLIEKFLKQIYKKYSFDTTEFDSGFYACISDIADLSVHIRTHSECEFFDQDVQSIEYIKEAVESKSIPEYKMAVEVGLIDIDIFPDRNFPWKKISVQEFASKADELKGVFEKLLEVYTDKQASVQTKNFLQKIFVNLKQKVDSLLDESIDITRQSFCIDIQFLLEENEF